VQVVPGVGGPAHVMVLPSGLHWLMFAGNGQENTFVGPSVRKQPPPVSSHQRRLVVDFAQWSVIVGSYWFLALTIISVLRKR
jgi:hypothetical protein